MKTIHYEIQIPYSILTDKLKLFFDLSNLYIDKLKIINEYLGILEI